MIKFNCSPYIWKRLKTNYTLTDNLKIKPFALTLPSEVRWMLQSVHSSDTNSLYPFFFHRGTALTMMVIVKREAGSTVHLSWEGVIMLPLKWILFWNTKHHTHSTDQPSHFAVPSANRTTTGWLLLCDLSVWKHLGQGEIYGEGANHAVEWDVQKTGFYYTKGGNRYQMVG